MATNTKTRTNRINGGGMRKLVLDPNNGKNDEKTVELLREQGERLEEERLKREIAEKELEDTNAQLVDMRDELIKLRIEKDRVESKGENLLSLHLFKKEMEMADDYLRTLLKDNLVSYSEIVEDSYPMLEHGSKKVKAQTMNHWFSSKDYCACADCQFLKSVSQTESKDGFNGHVIHKEFLISKNVNVRISFSPRKFQYVNKVSEKNVKEIKLVDQKHSEGEVNIKFFMNKTHNSEHTNYDFSLRKTMALTFQGTEYMTSFSAMIVVRALRELKTSSYNRRLMIFKNNSALKECGTCFTDFIKAMTGININRSMVTRICDLTEDEEVILLSTSSMEYIYIRMNDKMSMQSLNHISANEFEGCMKIRMYLLTTPTLREVDFYANSDTDSLQFEDDMDYNQDLSDGEEFEELLVQNSTSSDTEIALNRGKEVHLMKVVTPLSSMIRTRRDKLWWDKMGNLVDDFAKSKFAEMIKSEDRDEKLRRMFTNSQFSGPLFYNNPTSEDADMIEAFSKTFLEFKGVMFYVKDHKTLSDIVTNKDIKEIIYMLKVLPMRVYDDLSDSDNLTPESFPSLYTKFLSNLNCLEEMNTETLKRLFSFMKMRIFNSLMTKISSKVEDEEWNEIFNQGESRSDYLLRKFRNLSEEDKISILETFNHRVKVKRDLNRPMNIWSPKDSTRELFLNYEFHEKMKILTLNSNLRLEKSLINNMKDKFENL
jgi:hypothetical protein